MNIFLTGSSGFVGKNVELSFKKFFNNINFIKFHLNTESNLDLIHKADIVIHLAGKAHDIKNSVSIKDYYTVNTDLSKKIFDSFLSSNAKIFITLSSVKAVADKVEVELFEDVKENPASHYGKSKLLAEQYILSKQIPFDKRIYILRPCMIHGPGNKGNLNLLYSFVSKGLPWPLGNFENSRSYLSIENLCFIMKELIDRVDIPSGVYNVADDIPLSTNDLINIIAESKGKKAKILKLNTNIIKLLARIGDFLKLPLNTERLEKLTDNFKVSNAKIKKVLGKQLPVSSKDGLKRTFQSFAENA
jgi:nucleoside-diphosphate-sugar epimerase